MQSKSFGSSPGGEDGISQPQDPTTPVTLSPCQASAGHVGTAVASPGPQPWSPAPRGPLSRRQMACRLLGNASPSPFSGLWPRVPAHVAAEGRESAGCSRAWGWQQLGTGEPPTHAQTWPPPQHHHRAPRSPPVPRPTTARWLGGSARCLCLKDSALAHVPSLG